MKTSIWLEAAQLLPAAEGELISDGASLYYGARELSVYGCCDALTEAWRARQAEAFGASYFDIDGAVRRGFEQRSLDSHMQFNQEFQPSYDPRWRPAYWFDYDEEYEFDPDRRKCEQARVLALLFMHWMEVNP